MLPILFIFWLGPSLFAQTKGPKLTLKKEVGLTSRFIRLADLLIGDPKMDNLTHIYLGRSPDQGESRTITVTQITYELRRRGIRPLPSIQGESVRVYRLNKVDPLNLKPVKLHNVVVARRFIPGHATIRRGDIALEKRRLDCEPGQTFSDLESLPGCRTLLRIRKGEILTKSMIKPRPVIRKRQIVRAKSRFFETDARALQDGAVGEVIKLQYVDTKVEFYGEVISEGRVLISHTKGDKR
jgi:flagella basal body P-ring formation protein FlgA